MAGGLNGAGPDASRPAPPPLPPLREDLALAPGASDPDGRPTWTIYDPSMHRYVRVGWLEFEILSRWGLRDPEAVAASIRAETTLGCGAAEVAGFAAFALKAGLLQPTGSDGSAMLANRAKAGAHGPATWLLHNYLFLRLRLLNPDRFLGATLPAVSWMFGRGFLAALVALSLAGFFLVSRQWEEYVHGIADLFSFHGAVEVVLALSASKVLHEFGHGYAAKKMGCRVPSMGVAFLVMWPVLWTDVTDVWKLTRRRDRLLVDSAGILAEILLATAATFLWLVLPDGPARGAALTLSGSTWILTLLVNLNPLMRFDGYYILSDLLDVANLQDRGFALARWRLREALFGLGERIPERLPAHVVPAVYAWAYATWVYRFSLFLGIALLVYHMAFKALGFFLMGIEIWFFLAAPILRELLTWRQKVARTKFNWHMAATASVAAAALAAACVPWQGHVHAPAVYRAERQAVLYVNQPGRLVSTSAQGAALKAGDTPFVVESPEIEHAIRTSRAKLDGLLATIQGQTFDKDRVGDINVSMQEAQRVSAELASAQSRAAELAVVAPFDGILTDVPPGLRVGLDVARRETLGMLVDRGGGAIEAYVAEADLGRLGVGSAASFLPDTGGPAVPATVVAITASSVKSFEPPELSSLNGGPVRTRKDQAGRIVTEAAEYRLLLAPSSPVPGRLRRQAGTVSIDGERVSALGRVWRNAVAVAVRETGL